MIGSDTTMNRRSRREFLKLAGATALLAAAPGVSLAEPKPGTPVSTLTRPLGPQAFKKHLAGPILSLPTTFNADLSVNYDAVHQMIGRAKRYGIPIFELTAGNSKYKCLSYDEIKGVTRAMVEAADGRGLTIAATDAWDVRQAIEYAQYSESLGADAVQVLKPADMDDADALHAHFLQISRNTSLPIVLHGIYPVEALRRLAEIDSIVAMKEDGRLTYYIDCSYEFADRFEIFSGGAENRFLVGYPYGSRAFFATYSGFAPDKPMLFWDAIKKNDLKRAVEITSKYDYPFIRRFTHPFWHATLEYFGVATRYMREPFQTLPDNELAGIKTFFDGQGIDPADYIA